MNNYHDENLLLRVLLGYVKCKIGHEIIQIRKPTSEAYLEANSLYQREYIRILESGALTEDQTVELLQQYNMWTAADEKDFLEIDPKIEDEKVLLYNTFVSFGNVNAVRRKLSHLRNRQVDLYRRRHTFDVWSADYQASVYRLSYLIWSSSFRGRGKRRYFSGKFESADSLQLSLLVGAYSGSLLNDEQIRKLCKISQWKILWGLGRGRIFRKSPQKLTDNQLSLLSWSRFYDNVRKSPDCPTDEVINDNDMIDGWATVNHRKSQSERNKSAVEKTLDLHKDADEVFIVAHTQNDAARINTLNDSYGRMIQRQKFSQAEKHGRVSEVDMPSTRQDLQMKINQMRKG